MFVKNPETGNLFFFPHGRKGCAFCGKTKKYYLYEVNDNNVLEFQETTFHYSCNYFTIPFYSLEITPNMSFKMSNTENNDLYPEFNLLEIEIASDKIEYKERKINFRNFSSISLKYEAHLNTVNNKYARNIKTLVENLDKSFAQYHFEDICKIFYKSYGQYDYDIFFNLKAIFTHALAYNNNEKYKEMADSGFSSLIYTYSDKNKKKNADEINKMYSYLHNRKYSEIPDEYLKIIHENFWNKNLYAELFYKDNFNKKCLTVFKRIFREINSNTIEYFRKIKKLLNYENNSSPLKILNKIDACISYKSNEKKKRVSYFQLYALLKTLSDTVDAEKFSEIIKEDVNFQSLKESLEEIKKEELHKKYVFLNQEISKQDYRCNCNIDKIVSVQSSLYRIKRLDNFINFPDKTIESICQHFAKNFDNNDILVEVRKLDSGLIGIIKVNVKNGENKILHNNPGDTENLFLIKDEIFKFCHPIFLNRELN